MGLSEPLIGVNARFSEKTPRRRRRTMVGRGRAAPAALAGPIRIAMGRRRALDESLEGLLQDIRGGSRAGVRKTPGPSND